MEEKSKNKLQEALKNKLNKGFKPKPSNQNMNKRNKIHVDNVGKRPQNRGN